MERVLNIVQMEEARQGSSAHRLETLCTTKSVSPCAAPNEKSGNLVCAPKLVSNLLNGNERRIVVKRFEDGRRKITVAVWQFVSVDNQRG